MATAGSLLVRTPNPVPPATRMRNPASGLLLPFALHGKPAPYTRAMRRDRCQVQYRVTPAHCKTGVAASRQSMLPHLVTAAAAVLVDGRFTFGTHWLCSPNPRPRGSQDAVFVTDPDALGGLCRKCALMDTDGPGVYRFLNHEGRLLYVGSSGTVRVRTDFHQRKAHWRSQIADVQITSYPSLLAARAAEILAIGTEDPLVNHFGTDRGAA